jgi:hypothetical protein
MLTKENSALTTLSAEVLTTLPAPPSGSALIAGYKIGPDGATFSPPLTLAIKYRALPAKVDEKTIRIMYWNGNSWQEMGGSLNLGSRIVTTSISHLSQYAVVADLLAPARLTLSDLSLSPPRVNPGETVSVQTTLSNVGESAGHYDLVFKVNDAAVASQGITLEANQERLISFPVQRNEPGEYKVAINDKIGKFTVATPLPVPVIPAAPAATVVSGPLPANTDVATSPAAPSGTISPLPESGSKHLPNWLLIVLVILIMGGLAAFVISMLGRRKSYF